MPSPTDTAKSAILGVPPVATKRPSRQGTVQAFAEMDAKIAGAQAGALVFDTFADLPTTAVPSANIMAWVMNGTSITTGIYQNTGTASSPSWTRRGDIPQFYVAGINVGAGTADAIQITTDLPVPSADGAALISIPILAANTVTNPTVQINSGTVLTIISNSGGTIAVGNLVAGSFVSGFITNNGSNFRLLNEQAQAALLAQTEAARDEAVAVLGQLVGEVDSENANFTVVQSTDNRKLFEIDATSGAVTATLPDAVTATNGFEVSFTKTDSSANTITIDPDGAETIDGAATFVLRVQYQSVTIRCDGTEWHVVSKDEEGIFSSISGLTTLWEWPNLGGLVIKPISGNGSITIGGDPVPTTNQTPQVNLYPLDHPSWPGESIYTSVTATIASKGRPGNINLESQVAIRRFLMAGVRTSLVLGSGWDANDVPVADAPIHGFVPTSTLGTNPQVPGMGANATFNPGFVLEANVSGGGQFSTQMLGGADHLYHNIYAAPQNSRQFQDTYDHQNERVELKAASGASAPNTAIAYDYQTMYTSGKTSRSSGTVGAEFHDNGRVYMVADGNAALQVNRLSSDGAVVEIAGQSTVEGTISVSGTTVNYNSFHASHWSQLADRSTPEILFGTVCETIDELCDWYGLQYKHPVTGETIITEEHSDDIDLLAIGVGKSTKISIVCEVETEVETIRYEEKPVLGEEYEIDGYEFERVDDKVIRRPVKKKARDQLTKRIEMIDEDGSPVMEQVHDAMNPLLLKMRPVVIEEPVFETIEIKEKEIRRNPENFEVKAKVVRLENDRLVKFKISDTVASNRVYGTFVDWDKKESDLDVDALIGCLGAGFCRIDANETVKGGDILESAGNGCARVLRPKSGDKATDIAARAIGKVNAAIKIMEHDDGSYVVPIEHARG